MLPRNLDLNLLRVFDVLMEERSVTAAARRLNMTQPSASNALDRLRLALGDPLLERQGRAMVPSQFAVQLWPAVRSALEVLNTGFAQLQDFDPVKLDAHLRIGMDPYSGAAFGGKIAAMVLEEAPNATLSILPTVLNAVVDGELDMAVGSYWPSTGVLEHVYVRHEKFFVLLRKDHPGLDHGLSLEAYHRAPHVLLSGQGIVHGFVDGALEQLGLARRTSVASPQYTTLGAVVEASDCVATLGATIAERLAAGSPNLTTVEPPLTMPGFRVALGWHRRNARSPVHLWLKSLCTRALAVEG